MTTIRKIRNTKFQILKSIILVAWLCWAITVAGEGQEFRPTLLVFPPSGHVYVHKARPFHVKLLLGLRSGFANPQGVACARLAETDDPATEDDDDELTVYAANCDRHQVIYNSGLWGLESYGGLGSGDGRFHNPVGVAANPDGWVAVADMNNNRVVLLKNRKGRLRFVRNIGAGELGHPMGCALDSHGTIYVADTDNNRVAVYDSLGRLLSAFGAGQLDRPSAIAAVAGDDPWTYRHQTVIVAADSAGGRIRLFDGLGRLRATVTGDDIALPGAYFGALAIDYYGSVYATDMVNHAIHKFDHGLKYVASFGREGRGDREFQSPRGIAIWRRYGQVFVLERESAQYYWIGIDGYIEGVYPKAIDSLHPGVTISLQLYEPADFKIVIKDTTGNVVRTLVDEFRETLGLNHVVWDGRDDLGREVPKGEYDIEVTLEPTYSSKGYFTKTLTARVEKK